jgi:DNA polymerase III subunit beta
MTSDTAVDTGLRIRCSKEDLVSRLGVVSRGLSSRPSVQIFGGMLLQASADRLELSATDMELSVRAQLEVEVLGEGSAAVPGRLLTDIVRLLPESELELEYQAEENTLRVSAGSAEYRVRTYSVEDFPRLPDASGATVSTVEAEPFLASIERVGRAAGRDESRPVLPGIFARFSSGRLVMVATDSYRLSANETDVDAAGAELEAIIPARALEELRRVATGDSGIEVGTLDNHVLFGVGGVWLTTRRIDGQFPDHTKLIPPAEEFTIALTLTRGELLDVVRRVAVMAHRASPLRIKLEEGELTVSAQTQDVGEARESLPVAYGGETFEIGFNADYLRDGIESVEGDDVVLKLINPLRPGLVQGTDDSFRYLIMPIRLAG